MRGVATNIALNVLFLRDILYKTKLNIHTFCTKVTYDTLPKQCLCLDINLLTQYAMSVVSYGINFQQRVHLFMPQRKRELN